MEYVYKTKTLAQKIAIWLQNNFQRHTKTTSSMPSTLGWNSFSLRNKKYSYYSRVLPTQIRCVCPAKVGQYDKNMPNPRIQNLADK